MHSHTGLAVHFLSREVDPIFRGANVLKCGITEASTGIKEFTSLKAIVIAERSEKPHSTMARPPLCNHCRDVN